MGRERRPQFHALRRARGAGSDFVVRQTLDRETVCQGSGRRTRLAATRRGALPDRARTPAISTLRMSLLPSVVLIVALSGCAPHRPVDTTPQRPDVAPTGAAEPTGALQLDASQIKPMYTEMLAIDLPTVVQVAAARNFDIQRARQAVLAARGRLESAVGAAFPALVPTALFEHVEGTVRATEGALVGVGFNTFQPSLAIQWVINPGRVAYDIIAARKRVSASGYQQRAVILETVRVSVVQYYGLVLAQAHVAAAHQSALEAEELLRINRLRTQTGTAVPADELRAEARLAERRQDLTSAMMEFYGASVALAVTLHLDAATTLVPKIEQLPRAQLVRDDLPIDELLTIAVTFRPDLQRVRILADAVGADKGATWWGAFGPQFQAGYQYGGITGHANNIRPTSLAATQRGALPGDSHDDQTFGFSDQQRADASAGWRFSLSAFGNLKTADARHRLALIDAEMLLDRLRAEVVSAQQASRAHDQLIHLALQQVTAAAEALRITQANLRAGTMTTLDVLQAQDAATHARTRHAGAVVRYNQSQVNLLAAIGLIHEDLFVSATPSQLTIDN